MSNNCLRKRGQTSETITWIIATIIIIAILMVFIYASYALSKTKEIVRSVKGVFSGDEEEENAGWIKTKTLLAYEIDDGNKALIDKWIGENNVKEG